MGKAHHPKRHIKSRWTQRPEAHKPQVRKRVDEETPGKGGIQTKPRTKMAEGDGGRDWQDTVDRQAGARDVPVYP